MKHPPESTGPDAAGETASAPAVDPAVHRLLVVDDDTSVREMLVRVLVGEGYPVWAAANGTAALEIARSVKFDLVLLDLNLPGKSGWDTFESLSALDPMLTVIIVTARSNQLFTALGAGAGALLEKPLDFARLLETVTRLLGETAEAREARLVGNRADFHHVHGLPARSGKKPNPPKT